MFHLIFTVTVFASKRCNGQLGYGGNGYCSTCALSNSGSISRGFGYGGGNYVSSSNTANSDLASQNLYSLPTNNAFITPSNSYGYGTNGYGTGSSYRNTETSNTLNYGSPSKIGMSWNNAYGSTGNYGTGNGYINCYNNNCSPSTGFNTVPSVSASTGTGYGISGNSAIYNSYSSLPDTSYKTYILPSAYSVYSNLGRFPNTYNSNSHSGLETSYSLPVTYSSYPAMYGSYGNQDNINSLSNLLSLSSYPRSRKAAAADDASGITKSSSSSTSASS